jgi:S1-C subfamily serine protease
LTPRAGTSAVVVGNPFGQGQTSVEAIVGGFQNVRWDGRLARLQAMQAPIAQGHSGGGAFDQSTGELLGVTVAKSTVKSNTGYMVPVSDILAILERKRLPIHELEDSLEIYAELGVRLRAVRLIDGPHRYGMLITMVRPGSAAAHAGWEVGDVLVGLDKYQMVDLSAVLFVAHSPERKGSEIEYVIARGDSTARGAISLRRTAPSDAVAEAAQASTEVAVGAEPVLAAGR